MKENLKAIKNIIQHINQRKNNLIKILHDESIHKGMNSLYEAIINQDYWWVGIYEDVKNYVINCEICQQLHKTKARKSQINQIITKGSSGYNR